MSDTKKFPYRIFYLLCGIEAIIAIAYLASLPTDPKNIFFLGLSLNRLIILTIMVGVLLLSCFQLYQTRNLNYESKNFIIFEKILKRIVFFQPLILLGCWIVIFFPSYRFGKYEVIYSRIQPLLVLFSVIIFQLLILMRLEKSKKPTNSSNLLNKKVLGIFIVFVILIWVFLATTRIGLDIDHDFWGGAATPILPLVLIVSIFVPFYLIFTFKENDHQFRKLISVFPIILFFLAILIWNLEPFTPHFFAPKVQPPNYEYYPYSDAHVYDMTAQTLMNGEGYFNRGYVQRPLYGFMLFLFHKIMGQDYLKVVFLQTVLYAFFPVLFFYLGKKLFSPIIGIALGILAVLRELTAFQASPLMEIVHSKLYMTDNWAGFFALLITLLISIWYFQKKENYLLLVLTGGVMGISLLMRINLLLVFIPILFVVFIKERPRFFVGFRRIAVLGAAIFIFLLPWMLRNYVQIGEFGVEPQKFRMVIETRFNVEDEQEPEESKPNSKKPDPMLMPAFKSNTIFDDFGLSEILNVARFTTANFLHNEIHSVLIFPNSIFMESISGVIKDNAYIQETWLGEINFRHFSAIVINLCLIGLGLSIAFMKLGWFGFFPLSIHLFYNLSNGLARVSGWRYVIVTDWVIILYYIVGILFVVSWLFSKLNLMKMQPEFYVLSIEERKNQPEKSSNKFIWGGIIFLAIVAVGMLLPEIFIQPKYKGEVSKEEFRQIITTSNGNYNQEKLVELLSDPDSVVIHTKGYYPRFYYAGEGEPINNMGWIIGREYNQINFMISSPIVTGVTIEVDNPPAFFRNDLEVYIIGKWVETEVGRYIKSELVFFPENNDALTNGNKDFK